MRPGDEDNLERRDGDPEGFHVREKTETGYPLMDSSPAECAEAEQRLARIKADAMRDHFFEGEGRYCEARIHASPIGSAETGTITGWIGCGYGRDTHPLA